MDVPKQVQDKLAQFQNLQGQLQVISLQKQQFMLQGSDIENASGELGAVSEERVFRMVGPLLIETTKDAASKFLQDEKGSVDAKAKMLEKQEKKFVEKLNEMRNELQEMFKPNGGA